MEVFTLIVQLLDSSLRVATPLILAALAGLFAERSGVVDIGLEGKMLGAAFAAAATAYTTGSVWLGLVAAVVVSVMLALIHGFACITHRGNQVVSGVAINTLVMGLTPVLGHAWFREGGQTPSLSNGAPYHGFQLPYVAVDREAAIAAVVRADPELRTVRQVTRRLAEGDAELAARIDALIVEPTPVLSWLMAGIQGFLNSTVDFVTATRFTTINLPLSETLAGIPILGPIYSELISGHNIIVYATLALVPITAWVVYRTRFGLRVRAVGENPAAVDTAGISVIWMRYKAMIVCGLLCGIAGAYLSTAHNAAFVRDMTAGKGYLALAALIFAKWRPVPVLLTCLLFGFLEAMEARLQGIDLPVIGEVPVQLIQALPYIMVVVLLAGFIGRAVPPRASGIPYIKER